MEQAAPVVKLCPPVEECLNTSSSLKLPTGAHVHTSKHAGTSVNTHTHACTCVPTVAVEV